MGHRLVKVRHCTQLSVAQPSEQILLTLALFPFRSFTVLPWPRPFCWDSDARGQSQVECSGTWLYATVPLLSLALTYVDVIIRLPPHQVHYDDGDIETMTLTEARMLVIREQTRLRRERDRRHPMGVSQIFHFARCLAFCFRSNEFPLVPHDFSPSLEHQSGRLARPQQRGRRRRAR